MAMKARFQKLLYESQFLRHDHGSDAAGLGVFGGHGGGGGIHTLTTLSFGGEHPVIILSCSRTMIHASTYIREHHAWATRPFSLLPHGKRQQGAMPTQILSLAASQVAAGKSTTPLLAVVHQDDQGFRLSVFGLGMLRALEQRSTIKGFTPSQMDAFERDRKSVSLDCTPHHILPQRGPMQSTRTAREIFIVASEKGLLSVVLKTNNKLSIVLNDELFPDIPSAFPGTGHYITGMLSCDTFSFRGVDEQWIAVGRQNGMVEIVCRTFEGTTKEYYTTLLDGPISAVRWYTTRATCSTCKSAPHLHEEEDNVHLLVASALGFAVVFRDVMVKGIDNIYRLPYSDSSDTVSCALAIDITCNGFNELCLGTYGHNLLVYKMDGPPRRKEGVAYRLACRRSFSSPLYCLASADCTGDGIHELLVSSFSGLHILRPDSSALDVLVKHRLEHLRGVGSNETGLPF